MSQATQTAPTSAAAPAPTAPAAIATTASGSPTPATPALNTPRLLRRLTVALMVGGIVAGVVGALVLSYLAYSLNRAEADTAQLIRVQKIQTNLLSADATATNAFLVGGLEPAAQRAAYDQAITATGALIAEAARAQPADGDALAALNQQVTNYAATIEQARANNRQGFPVGAQYLRNASGQLRASALPILDNLVASNAERASSEMTAAPGWVAIAVGVLAVAGYVVAQVRVARRFRRRINVGLLAGSVVLFVALVATMIGVFQLSSTLQMVRTGSYAAVNNAAEARIRANDAKSNESLTLIARGSGGAFENAWKSSADQVSDHLRRLEGADGALAQKWSGYVAAHQKIRTLDDGGSWDNAVALATGDADNGANRTFSTFDTALAAQLDQANQQTSSSLAGTQPGLVIGAILLFAAGLGAALLARQGVAVRLKEYR